MRKKEIDNIISNALLNAVAVEYADVICSEQHIAVSTNHRKIIERMIKEPDIWIQKREKRLLKSLLRRAACFAAACLIALSAVLCNQSARATVLRWISEWHDTYLTIRFQGDNISSNDFSSYEISVLPEGYHQSERVILPPENPMIVSVEYENEDGGKIFFQYVLMQDGTASSFVFEDTEVLSISVNGINGQYFPSDSADIMSTITWIDEKHGIEFIIDGCFERSDMLEMAESVAIKK